MIAGAPSASLVASVDSSRSWNITQWRASVLMSGPGDGAAASNEAARSEAADITKAAGSL